MANVFDQFDTPVLSPQQGQPNTANIFDQFDTPHQPESWGEYGMGLLQKVGQGATFGFGDEIAAGAGALGNKAMRAVGVDVPERNYSDILGEVRGDEAKFAERNPKAAIAAEIGGGLSSIAAGPIRAVAAAPTWLGRAANSAKVGAGYGAASGFGNSEGGVGERVTGAGKGAAVGAAAGPLIADVALPLVARTVAAVPQAFRYANQAARNANNPEQAAINNVADRMVKEGIDPAAVRAEVSPPPSSQLAQRPNPKTGQNFTEADMADIISRGIGKGETAKSIAADYGIHESTVGSYLAKYRNSNPTERNVIDISKDLAGEGKAAPLARLGRAAYSLSDDGDAAQRLITRQQTQAGRVSNIVDRAGGGRNFDDEITRLDDVLGTQAKAAYAAADKNAQPFNLRPVIGKYRRAAFGRAGELREQTEKALDMFFEPVMGAQGTVRKLGQPISDLKRFQAARQDLDQMVARSMQDGKPTPLTRQLTQLRQELTSVVRAANKDLAIADDLFSGAKSSEKLLEQGAKLTTRLGAPSRQILDGFEKLKPEQQEIIRLGFLRKLQDMGANARDGAAVANQFNSPAVRQTIERIFPKSDKAAYARGQQLVKDLRQEATTTRTKNDILSGSRTAELGGDMSKAMQGAQAAADLATGRFGKVLENLATRLSSQIGERGSKEVLRVLTETDPAKMLPILNQLAQAAKTTQQRQAYVAAIREIRSGAFARAVPGIGAAAGQQQAVKK